jgi:polyhydroxyalkanoate synthesis regulator phasin
MDFSLHPGVCVQDIGGSDLVDEPPAPPFNLDTLREGYRKFAYWEGQVHAVVGLLVGKGLLTLDEMRRGVESLSNAQHTGGLNYYERWASSVLIISLERGTITQADLDRHMGPPVESCDEPSFSVGQRVRVRAENIATRWRRPHLRTPGYIFGAAGVVERYVGVFDSPELNAFQHVEGVQPLYRVRFAMGDVWREYDGPAQDTIDVEIYQSWLDEGTAEGAAADTLPTTAAAVKPDLPLIGGAGRTTIAVQSVQSRNALEQAAVDAEAEAEDVPLHVAALLAVMVENGVLTADEIREGVQSIENWGAKAEGPRIIAKAW